jgi:hypothetical protein
MRVMLLAEVLGQEGGGVGSPRHVRCVGERVDRFAHVWETLRLRAKLGDALLESELTVDRAELLGDGGDGGTVQVEAAVGVPSRREQEKCSAAGPARLVLVDGDLLACNRREDDQHGCEAVLLAFGE